MNAVIVCPSGLSGRIRGMKVKEERILTDRKLAKNGGQIEQLLAACWEETVEPGPYDFVNGKINWDRVLQGDRFYTLLQIRAQTYGPIYEFAVHCQNPSCADKIEWELDLNDLDVRPLSEESRQKFIAGNRFETTLQGPNKKIIFGLPTGEIERKLPQIKRNAQNRMLSAVLALRIQEIEGIKNKDKRQFIEDLSMRDADLLVEQFDAVDCGVDTDIEIECPHCFLIQEVNLPFEADFLMPGQKKKRRDRTNSFPR